MYLRLVLALVVTVAPASAEVYSCREGGRTIIRDQPCDGQGPRIPPGAVPLGAPQVFPPPAIPNRTGVPQNVIAGRVVSIGDGDTVTLLDASRQQHKIRIAGIDAPEKAQPFGQRAKANLATLAFDRMVSADFRKADRYGREICVIQAEGVDVGLEQVRAGMAWWYRQYARVQTPGERTAYERAEFEAKTQRRGLWADKNPVEPWEWRRGAQAED